MTWKAEAASIIAGAVKDLPADATLAQRQRVVDAARPSGWMYMSWPQKAWQAARRNYLVRYGYKPRTKAQAERDRAVLDELPMFARAAAKGKE